MRRPQSNQIKYLKSRKYFVLGTNFYFTRIYAKKNSIVAKIPTLGNQINEFGPDCRIEKIKLDRHGHGGISIISCLKLQHYKNNNNLPVLMFDTNLKHSFCQEHAQKFKYLYDVEIKHLKRLERQNYVPFSAIDIGEMLSKFSSIDNYINDEDSCRTFCKECESVYAGLAEHPKKCLCKGCNFLIS